MMKPKRPRISGRKTYYLVLWWMSQTPYAAIFENQVAAEAAANVRNALMVTISGRDVKVDQVLTGTAATNPALRCRPNGGTSSGKFTFPGSRSRSPRFDA